MTWKAVLFCELKAYKVLLQLHASFTHTFDNFVLVLFLYPINPAFWWNTSSIFKGHFCHCTRWQQKLIDHCSATKTKFLNDVSVWNRCVFVHLKLNCSSSDYSCFFPLSIRLYCYCVFCTNYVATDSATYFDHKGFVVLTFFHKWILRSPQTKISFTYKLPIQSCIPF